MNDKELLELFKQRALLAEGALTFLRDASIYEWCTREYLIAQVKQACRAREDLLVKFEQKHPN